MKRWVYSCGIILVIFCCTAGVPTWSSVFEQIKKDFPGVPQLSTEKLADWLVDDQLEKPLIFDTRSEKEYQASHLKGARHVPPGANLKQVVSSVSNSKTMVFYCSVGVRSSQAVQQIQTLGYTNAYNLEGSIFKWANEGRPVVRDGHVVQEVHPFNSKWGVLLKASLHPPKKQGFWEWIFGD